MHIFLLAEVRADNAKDALEQAKSLIEDSLEERDNTCGWDYVGDCKTLTKKDLAHYGIKTFKEFKENLINERKERIKVFEDRLLEELRKFLIPKYLPLSEAPLYLEGHGGEVSKILKTKRGGRLPKDYDEFEKAIMSVFNHIASKRGFNMAEYYRKMIKELWACINNPQDKYKTLQSTDNHFADLTADTTGKKTYYVSTDRHC